ncbi:MAG: hypothetical protein U9N45_04190, partial [Gemmatimonadota bacterium]|nr:hypothetical protein [Gemmatimonadota bacterium]
MSKKVLLLNSACGKYPRGRDPWVRATVAALDTLASRGDISLVSSLGLPSWELTTFLAGKLGTRLDLIVPGSEFEVPGSEEYNRLLEDFGLDGRKTVFHFTGAGSPGERMAGRDRMAFELAGEVCLVSIRPRGRLERLICEHEGCARLEFCDEFRIEWQDTQWRPRYDFEGRTLNPEL